MSYFKNIQWNVVPTTHATVKKSCPKCGKNATFINTEKFRVNANKSNIDIWLIYHCEKCKSTWNMTIFERIHPKKLPGELFERFMNNDVDLAKEYGFNKQVYLQNKVEMNLEKVTYEISGEDIDLTETDTEGIKVNIKCEYPMGLRLGKIISKKLKQSRKELKGLIASGNITVDVDEEACEGWIKQKLNGEKAIYVHPIKT